MIYTCPDCSEADLDATARIHIDCGPRTGVKVLCLLACPACAFRGATVSRALAGAEAPPPSAAYRLTSDLQTELATAIGLCPAPTDPGCPCHVHAELGRANVPRPLFAVLALLPGFDLIAAG